MSSSTATASAVVSQQPLVEIRDVTKRFGATQALRGVSFDVRPDETLGLLGANGAGKSTLIKVLAGIQPATSGEILLEGRQASISTPAAARNSGIVTVLQNIDDGVVFGMTVAENLFLDQLSTGRSPFLSRRSIRQAARGILDKLGLELPLDVPVESLSASGRQEVSIARALVKEPKLLILDEPTSTLSSREADRLFAQVAHMRERGISVLYVSHHMSEIMNLCDRAVVLRNGEVVSGHEAPLDAREITQAILGELQISLTHTPRQGSNVVLAGQGLRANAEGRPFDVEFRKGEVVGITGLVGAGKTELLEQLYGARNLLSGSMTLAGERYAPRDAADALTKGVVMMPEERAVQAIFPGASLAQHCTIGRLRRSSRGGVMDFRRELSFTRDVIDSVKVKCSGPTAPIESLSGGNQQKILVGRWLAEQYAVIMLDEPFRGIDIGARAIISAALRRYSEHAAVVVVSSDPEEVIEVADRVLIMVNGQVTRDVPADELSADELADLMSAVTTEAGALL